MLTIQKNAIVLDQRDFMATLKKNGYSKCTTETNLEQIPIDDERTKHEWEHEESIVEEETIFAQFFALEFLFGVHAIGCCENIVQQHEDVTHQIERQVISATNNC